MSYLDSVFSLSGKVVVVTGATGGIGQAITLSLAEAGASKVYALDLDNNAIWPNSNIENYSLDLQDENQINRFVEYIGVRHVHGANILVNCAGVSVSAGLDIRLCSCWDSEGCDVFPASVAPDGSAFCKASGFIGFGSVP